jgi:hypothetical protein
LLESPSDGLEATEILGEEAIVAPEDAGEAHEEIKVVVEGETGVLVTEEMTTTETIESGSKERDQFPK